MQESGLICDSRTIKDWSFGRPSILQSCRMIQWLAHCLVKVVKRSLDDTEVKLLFEKGEPEHMEIPRGVLQDNPPAKASRDSVRKERISIRLEPVIDQRFDEISKEAVEQDQDRVSVMVPNRS